MTMCGGYIVFNILNSKENGTKKQQHLGNLNGSENYLKNLIFFNLSTTVHRHFFTEIYVCFFY